MIFLSLSLLINHLIKHPFLTSPSILGITYQVVNRVITGGAAVIVVGRRP